MFTPVEEARMFLSKVCLPQGLQRNFYEVHRQLWQLFPYQPQARRDFLFRVEGVQPGQGLIVLLQSGQALKTQEDTRVLASKPFAPVLSAGKQLRFRLRANPVRTIHDQEQGRVQQKGRDAGKLKHCRVPLLKEDQQRDWLQRKLADTACLDNVLMQQEAPLYFHKGDGGKRVEGKIQSVLFDGSLTINDGDGFVALLSQGIGPAKAFGCGLLSIAPA
jgi:CRISPR system Cascade subunit CasE